MRKICLLFVCLFAGITAKAQASEPPSNVIKVNGGLSFITSKMYLPDYTHGARVKSQSWQPGFMASADYEHYWKSGWGFGLNFFYDYTSYRIDGNKGAHAYLDLKSTYIGPSLAYSGCFNKYWRVACAFGMGYGHLGGDLSDSGGFGMMYKAGIEYMVNSHFGLGVELNELVIYTKEDDGMKKLKKYATSESDVTSGMSCLGLAAGVRFYF